MNTETQSQRRKIVQSAISQILILKIGIIISTASQNRFLFFITALFVVVVYRSRLFNDVIMLPLQCLPDPNNYHEFCRLLARLKSNYQLGELVKVENYPEVIRLIANFTVTSLQVGAVARNIRYSSSE